MNPKDIEALVMAGGSLEEGLRPLENVPTKALLTFGTQKTLLERTLDALLEAGVENVGVVASSSIPQSMRQKAGVRWVEEQGGLIDNVLAGLEALGRDYVLVVTVDLPFLKGKDLTAFLEACKPGSADLFVSVLSQEAIERQFPGAKRTYGKLKEGKHTSGNVFLVDRKLLLKNAGFLRDLIALRKKPFRLALRVGLGTLFKLVIGRLSINDVENVILKLTGARAQAVVVQEASLGMDVDKEADFLLAREILGQMG